MAVTRLDRVGDGSTTIYDVAFALGYLKREYVFVYLESTAYTTQLDYAWLNDNQIELNSPLAVGTKFSIRRVVPRDSPVNDYEAGAILRESNLDDSFIQSLMILEEVEDGYIAQEGAFLVINNIDMQGSKVVNSGNATDHKDLVPLEQLTEIIAMNTLTGAANGSTPMHSVASLEEWTRALLAETGVIDTGAADTQVNSKRLEAIKRLIGSVVREDVATMKSQGGLLEGLKVVTRTYKGGGKGGAEYLVVSKANHDTLRGTTTVDGQWDHVLLNDLVAIMVKQGTHARIEQAGIYAGEDPVQAIRTGIGSKYFKKVELEEDTTYPVSSNWPNVGGFKTPISLNGVHQELRGTRSVLQLEQTNLDGYNIISNTGIECGVKGCIIRGDKTTHIGTTGEFGMGVANRGSIGARMEDLVIENCWGDGWYEGALGGGNSRTLNTKATNVTINNCRRNGWSLISAKGLRAKDIVITDTSGTAPQAGLDIEPNTIADDLEDIIIDGITTSGNVAGGITLYLGGWSAAGTTEKSLSITIRNHVSKVEIFPFVCTRLFYEAGDKLLAGHLTMIDPVAVNSLAGGYFMRDWSAIHPITINLVRPKLVDCNTTKGVGLLANAAFASYRLLTDAGTDTTQGGLTIESPVVEFTTNTAGPMASLFVHNNYKAPTVPNYNTKGFSVHGKARAMGAYSSLPPSYMQGSFDIDFSELTLTQSQSIGLTASTSAVLGKLLLVASADKTLTVNPATYITQPIECVATSNHWKLSPPAGGRFILNGAYLGINQQVRTNANYGAVMFTISFSENLAIPYITANPSNGLVVVP